LPRYPTSSCVYGNKSHWTQWRRLEEQDDELP
jgi:hypothetical protein